MVGIRCRCIKCGCVMVNAYVSKHGKMERFGYICERCMYYEPPAWWSFLSDKYNKKGGKT
jgi:hypothetical protein